MQLMALTLVLVLVQNQNIAKHFASDVITKEGLGGQLQRLQKYMRRKIMSCDFISLLSVSTYNYIRFILFTESKKFI